MESGYSGTPLAKKLGLKPSSRVLLLKSPESVAIRLHEGCPEADIESKLHDGPVDVAVAFCITVEDLDKAFQALIPILSPSGGIWIAWPKKASGVATELGDGIVRDLGLATGLVDNKVCAIDETWSGLRFVIRLKNR